jgi:hypothetical protein
VWHRPETLGSDALEHRRVRLRRILGLEPTEPDRDDAALAVLRRVPDDSLGLFVGRAPIDVGRQADLDAVELAGRLCAVAVTAEDLVPVDAPLRALCRREAPLEVDGAVAGCLLRVVDDDLPKVLVGLEREGGQDPHLDEVREVAVVVEQRQPLRGVRGERVVVSPRDLEQRLGPHGPLEMDVELDFRGGHSVARRLPAAQRRSMKTESQIEPSKRTQSGMTSNASETGSTVGRRIAPPSSST